jgi:hypothetical protein
MVLPRCWFDAEKTRKGIHALRHYKRMWNESAQAWRSAPVHDHASHGADSLRYMALGVRETAASVLDDILEKQFAPVPREYARGGDAGWMSR